VLFAFVEFPYRIPCCRTFHYWSHASALRRKNHLPVPRTVHACGAFAPLLVPSPFPTCHLVAGFYCPRVTHPQEFLHGLTLLLHFVPSYFSFVRLLRCCLTTLHFSPPVVTFSLFGLYTTRTLYTYLPWCRPTGSTFAVTTHAGALCVTPRLRFRRAFSAFPRLCALFYFRYGDWLPPHAAGVSGSLRLLF